MYEEFKMKTMTCKQLGGACNEEFHANTFEEMKQISQKHAHEMYKKNDEKHMKVMKKMMERNNKPQHVVFRYNYTMEQTREYVLDYTKTERSVSFEKIFEVCENRIHALFLFLSLLELAQQQYMSIITGDGRNNFIIEWNEDRVEDTAALFTIGGQPIDPSLN